MFTDMIGYTALGQRNESLSLALVEEQRKLIRPILGRHNGREVDTIGDAFLVEFPSALDSIRCAYDIQRAAREFNFSLPEDRRIHLRIGVHLGDVVESGGDISGDAVNVASRIEPLSEDGGVCLTRQVYDHVRNKFELPMVSLGSKALKNVSEPVEVYRLAMPWEGKELGEKPEPGTSRIAVLPFANLSQDPNDEYFADGLTEEMITELSMLSGLGVIARTSVMHYKKTDKTIREIAKELNVGSVLEGSVRKAGNKIRVTVQLIQAKDEGHLWAQKFDRSLDDIFEVQSDVAKNVVDALRVKLPSSELDRIEKKPTESTNAYTLYLKGRHLWNKRGLEDLKKARDYFEQAVKEDPGFALGYVGQADCCLQLRHNFAIDPETNLEKATLMVGKALELEPDLAEAHATKGNLLMGEYEPRLAEKEFKRAIELKPSYAYAHMWYFGVLLDSLRWDEARIEIEKALELDPLAPAIHWNHGEYYYGRREYARAIEPYRRAIELGNPDAHSVLAMAYGRMKMYDDMKRESAIWVDYAKNAFPDARKMADAMEAYLSGDKQTLAKLLPELETRTHGGSAVSAYWVGVAHFFLGDIDLGFEWLEQSYAAKEPHLQNIAYNGDADMVLKDPRYLDLLKRLGLG
jgi:adenylate cyclase